MGDATVDFFLETLRQQTMPYCSKAITRAKHQLEFLAEEIKYMRGFLQVTEKKRNEHSELMNLVTQIKHVVSEVENIVEQFVVEVLKANESYEHVPSSPAFLEGPFSEEHLTIRHSNLSLDIESVKKKIKTLRAEVKQIYDKNICDINGVAGKELKHSSSKAEGGSSSSRSNTSKVREENVVVGFKEEVETLMGKLHDHGESGRLEIISIIGAAGAGKTTLAQEVYDHPFTSHTFEVRAWINVSQDYDMTMKKNLLIRILESTSSKKHGDYEKSSEDKLGENTYNCLKGKKYLIVMDDIWDTKAWDGIQRSLPRQSNGSKVLFTSRLLVEPKSIPYVHHYLSPLPKSCSWELLQKKIFGKKFCPPELVVLGKHIAQKCEGLPLAIITIAGILATKDNTLDVWEEVSKNLSSVIAENQDSCMKILELSYNHLPLHLKVCFVYVGGFPEDSEILVRKLIWLWIAEGFIQQSEGDKSLEDVAEDYLRSLIDRNLVMVARKSLCGRIKACRIHDLLRELCLKKVEEHNLRVQIYGDDTFSPYAKDRCLFISHHHQLFDESSLRPCTQNLRSFLHLNLQNPNFLWFLSFLVKNFELFRALFLISDTCQGKIGRGHLVHLRYLALKLTNDFGPSVFVLPFSCLFNLETCNLQGSMYNHQTIPLPCNIFKSVKLRHLYAKHGTFQYHLSCLHPVGLVAGIGCEHSSKLDSLQTLDPICPCEECRKFLVRTPNLRKIGFEGKLISNDFVLKVPDLEFMECLETLSFKYRPYREKATTLPSVLKFPPTIKQLTLYNTGLKWEDLSILIQALPNLEVLKLLPGSCLGQIWITSEEGFSQLKYLMLQGLDIEKWNASEDQFLQLEVLVVKYCRRLEWIPSDFAKLNELRKIEVRGNYRCVEKSVRKIQEERINARGDDGCIDVVAGGNYYFRKDRF